MNLSYITSQTDTFDILCKQVKALSTLNTETFLAIQRRNKKGETVVVGYHYRLHCKLESRNQQQTQHVEYPQHTHQHLRYHCPHVNGSDSDHSIPNSFNNNDDKNTPTASPWTFKTEKDIQEVSKLIHEWKYHGEPLEVDGLFGNINLDLKSYQDVARLTKDLKELGAKFMNVSSSSYPIEDKVGLRNVLSNMERLQVALGELHEITMDVVDNIDADRKEMDIEMKKMVEAYQRISKKLPMTELQFYGDNMTKNTEIRHLDKKGYVMDSFSSSDDNSFDSFEDETDGYDY